jgi:hypothetical protein
LKLETGPEEVVELTAETPLFGMNWPGQLFIRKAITKFAQDRFTIFHTSWN